MTTLLSGQRTLEDDSPGREEGLEQGHAGELIVLPVVCIQARQRWLNRQVGEAICCCGEDVGDAGVNILIVAGVTAELPAHGVVTHDVWQIVPEHKHLRQTERVSKMLSSCFSFSNATRLGYLCVSAHDLAGLLVERLTVPIWVQSLQLTSQPVVLTHKQRVNGRQGDVFVHADVT